MKKEIVVIEFAGLSNEVQKEIKGQGISSKVFDSLILSVKKSILSSVEKAIKQAIEDTKKDANKTDKEREKLEKQCLKADYQGLFSIFNFIKKESKFSVIKPKVFEAREVLGTMNFNEFVSQVHKVGRYSFDQLYKYCSNIQHATEGDKVTISKKGWIINALIMAVKNELITPNDAIDSFILLMGQPIRENKKGEKTLLIGVSSAKYMKLNAIEIFERYELSKVFEVELSEPKTAEAVTSEVLEVVISEGLTA